MSDSPITVVYKWTAKPGQLDALKAIYARVTAQMEAHEPGALAVDSYVSEADNALYIRDEFANAEALGFHLGTTAAGHFPELLAVADPGAFLFFGQVPAELQAATRQMGLQAEFAGRTGGFAR
ncbi:MAG: hypothetical protein EP330_13140 [Deltaproteobacteria bacterium]|nr:MAG: hypothetical protein EP330_13140 [Deltaproteobacteria bacterium]